MNNFSFFNRRAAIQTPAELEQYLAALLQTREGDLLDPLVIEIHPHSYADIAAGRLVYDPALTYMTFVVGDGDNTAFMKGGRRGWMAERVG